MVNHLSEHKEISASHWVEEQRPKARSQKNAKNEEIGKRGRTRQDGQDSSWARENWYNNEFYLKMNIKRDSPLAKI